MMAMLSTEFWVVFQTLSICLLLVLLVYFIRHSRSGKEGTHGAEDSARKIVAMMEPLLNEAESSARIFESQIMEKNKLIRELNDKLDSRIISLNLLLNRADAYLSRSLSQDRHEIIPAEGIYDTQEAILSLYQKGMGPQDIATELSVSHQEVDLVISLKKKFIAMEKGS